MIYTLKLSRYLLVSVFLFPFYLLIGCGDQGTDKGSEVLQDTSSKDGKSSDKEGSPSDAVRPSKNAGEFVDSGSSGSQNGPRITSRTDSFCINGQRAEFGYSIENIVLLDPADSSTVLDTIGPGSFFYLLPSGKDYVVAYDRDLGIISNKGFHLFDTLSPDVQRKLILRKFREIEKKAQKWEWNLRAHHREWMELERVYSELCTGLIPRVICDDQDTALWKAFAQNQLDSILSGLEAESAGFAKTFRKCPELSVHLIKRSENRSELVDALWKLQNDTEGEHLDEYRSLKETIRGLGKDDEKEGDLNDTLRIIKRVLDLRDLEPFLHKKIEGRMPIKVLKNGLLGKCCSGRGLSKIKFVDGSQIITKEKIERNDNLKSSDISPYFVVKKLVFYRNNTEAKIILGYPIEGVVVEAEFKKDPDWALKDSKIFEE